MCMEIFYLKLCVGHVKIYTTFNIAASKYLRMFGTCNIYAIFLNCTGTIVHSILRTCWYMTLQICAVCSVLYCK